MMTKTLIAFTIAACIAIPTQAVTIDQNLLEKWSDRYTMLEGLDFFEPQLRVGGGRSKECQPCVKEATEFTLRKAAESFANECTKAANKRFQYVCELSRQHPKFALGMLLEKLNPVKLAFAYCAGRRACEEEQSNETRDQEIESITHIDLKNIFAEVQEQTLVQLKRIPEYDPQVARVMTPMIEEIKSGLLDGQSRRSLSRRDFEDEDDDEYSPESLHEYDDQDDDDFRVVRDRDEDRDTERLSKKLQYKKFQVHKLEEKLETSSRFRNIVKRKELEKVLRQKRFQIRQLEKELHQKREDMDLTLKRFDGFRMEQETDNERRESHLVERERRDFHHSRCEECIEQKQRVIMEKVSAKVYRLCQEARQESTRRFCETARSEPELISGYLVSKVEPYKYASGYCRGRDQCSTIGVEDGRQQLTIS